MSVKVTNDVCMQCGDKLQPRGQMPPKGHAAVAICETCGHLMMLSADNGLEKLQRAWLVENMPVDVRAEVHELQEKRYHKLGQWG